MFFNAKSSRNSCSQTMANNFEEYLFKKNYPIGRITLYLIILFQIISFLGTVLYLIGGLNVPGLIKVPWLKGSIDLQLNRPILFKKLTLETGPVYTISISLWTICEYRGYMKCFPLTDLGQSKSMFIGVFKF